MILVCCCLFSYLSITGHLGHFSFYFLKRNKNSSEMKKKTLLYFKMFSRVKFRRRSNWTQTVSYTFINMHIKHHVMYLLEINSNSAGWLLSIPNSFLPSHHLPHLRETKGSILTFDFTSIPVHMVRYFYGVCRAWDVKANAGSKFCVSHLLFSYLFCPAWSMYIDVSTPAFQWP